MQGGGEVVMLRDLRNAGVAVTLLCGEPKRHSFICRKSPNRFQSNVETNTDACLTDSAVQIDCCTFKKNTHTYYTSPAPKWEHPHRSTISRILRNTDSFAGSLRKYPHPGDLGKSQSYEIVQRILSYAQGRSFSKRSKCRSMRSLLRKPSNHKRRNEKRSVGIVTNSRPNVLFGSHSDTMPAELDTRYNYLNTRMSRPGLEVRYLSGLRRAICTKIMDACDDAPKVCPKIRSRFSHHKKYCRRQTCPPKYSEFIKNMEVQASPKEAKVAVTSHGMSTHADKYRSCFCQTQQECVCKTKLSDQPTTLEDALKKMFPESDLTEPEKLSSRVEELIKEWIHQVPPFYSIDIANDQKEDFIKKMLDELKYIENMQLDEVKTKIFRCLSNIPVLRDKRDSIVDDMGQNLVNKLKFLLVQQEWQQNIANVVTDILSKYNLSEENRQLITKAVTQKLKPIIMNRALNNDEFKGYLTDELLGLIQKLPLDVKDDVTRVSKNNSDKSIQRRENKGISNDGRIEDAVLDWINLLPEISNVPVSETKELIAPLVKSLAESENSDDIKAAVKKWLNNVIKKDGKCLTARSINKLTRKLVSKLQPVQNLQRASESQVKIRDAKKDAKSIHTPRASQQTSLFKEIKKWVNNSVDDNTRNLEKFTQLTQKLADDLESIGNENYDDSALKRKVNDTIKRWIYKLNKDTGAVIPPKERQSLAQIVVSQMKQSANILSKAKNPRVGEKSSKLKQSYANQLAPKGRKKWRKATPKRDIHDGVTKVLNKYSSNYMNKTKEDLISKITDEIEHKLNAIPRPNQADTKAPISHILKDFTKFSENDIDAIASAVVNKVVGFSTPHVDKIVFPQREGSNYDSNHESPSEDEFSERTYDSRSDTDDEPRALPKHKVFKNIAQDISQNIDKFLGNDERQRATSTPDRDVEPSLETLSVPSIHQMSRDDEKNTATNRVKSILRDWLKELNIDGDLKNKIINELSEDILDRQKYLKISNSAVKNSVELEHLKFQVFKRLNKVVSDQELTNFMSKIEDLAGRFNIFGSDETSESLLYKKQIRIVISENLPNIRDESFEVFKHDLADAFVSLHFYADDYAARNKYKMKIREEISNFCCDYLIRYPESHLDAKEINKELYIALLRVPVPSKESLEPTHNISIIQEEIHKWLNNTQPSILKSMNIRNSTSILAKSIYSLQKSNSEQDVFKIISDWLREFSSVTGRYIDIATEAQILHNNITEVNRPRDININVTQNIEIPKVDNTTQYTPFIPQSNLSAEDRAHLNRIRARQAVKEIHVSKDASCGPPPRNVSTQTDNTDEKTKEKSINVDITPQVLIQEYSWQQPAPVSIDVATQNITPQNISQTTNVSQVTNQQTHSHTNVQSTQNLESYPNIEMNQRPVISGFPAPFERLKSQLDGRKSGDRVLKCCKCGGQVITKCRSKSRHDQRMCSKCYSGMCPHPTPLYFQRDF